MSNAREILLALDAKLTARDLYVSHFFTEDQVILRPDWRKHRVPVPGPWQRLDLYRLGDTDLLLTKLMRDDPLDRKDALFIVERSGVKASEIKTALREARVPAIPEIAEQFAAASRKLLKAIGS